MIAITGASGQLGRMVIDNLLKEIKPSRLIAIVRNPEKVADLKALGIGVRKADYSHAETLPAALQGAEKLLLISSSEIGQRRAQHANVIEAAKGAGVSLIAYTSVLHADINPLPLALEHRETEAILTASIIPYILLRNGWYTENYTAGIPVALEYGALLGCAGDGKI
jgi:NAD(P)H dehydrogenase (quinone)